MFDWLVGAVGNWVKSWTSKPAAPKPKPGPAPIKVTTNTGMQGSSYNPQQTYNPQYTRSTSYYQRAAQAVAAQRAAAAEAARQEAIRQEKLRIIREKTAQHQGRLNVYANKFKGSVTVAKAKNYIMSLAGRKGHWSEYLTADGKLIGGGKYDEKTAPTRVRNAYAQLQKVLASDGGIEEADLNELAKAAKSKYRLTAQDLIKQRKGKNLWDEIAGRKSAQAGQADMQYKIADYEKRLKNFKKLEGQWHQKHLVAKNKGDIDGANRIADEFNKWYTKEVRGIVRYGAGIEGLSSGYEQEANAPYKTRFGGYLNKLHSAAKGVGDVAGGIFKYTIGQGSQSVPSLVTAPERLVNFVRNQNGNNGASLNYHDPTRVEGLSKGSLLDKWRQTFQQRALNQIHPDNYIPGQTTKPKGLTDKEWQLHQALLANSATNKMSEFWSSVAMGGGTKFLGKGIKALNKGGMKLTDRFISDKLYDGFMKSAPGRGIQWLGKEHKTTSQKTWDIVQETKAVRAVTQSKLWPQYQKALSKVKGSTVDLNVVDDLGKLTDKEAVILQRMRGFDKFSRRDEFVLKRNPQLRAKLLDIHQRWQGIAANMRLADEVKNTRFAGNYYSKGWQPSPVKDAYNFRKFRKSNHALTAKDLHASQIERLFMSKLDEVGPQVKGAGRNRAEAQRLLDEYDDAMKAARDKEMKASNWNRNKYRRGAAFVGNLPMGLWKLAALPLRPAWYVNNVAYNELAGALSAGPRFFAEQAKLLKPGALTTARAEHPEVVSKLAENFKGNRFYRAASAIEDNARLAAFRANRAKGKSDGQSLKRTNDYLLDYTTKNWERPIKSVLPFWSWTKGINKATIKMPFDRPGAAGALHDYDEKTQRELGKLPADQRKFYERGVYWGKDGKGNPKFLNAPWLPFTSSNAKNVGINPYLAASSELLNNKDYYGNPLENKGMLATLASKFPQYNVINDMMRSGFSTAKYLSERGSEGFAMTKQKVIDNNERGLKSLKSFIGWNDARSFDWERQRKFDHQGRFMKEWFDRDWAKEFDETKFADSNAAYEAKRSAQEALAKKYGYDLQKDVYNGFFSKNDTETTSHLKMLKDQAAVFGDKFWAEYKAQPYGTRSRWANEKMKEIEASGKLGRNAYINSRLPKWHSAENAIKYSGPAKANTAVQYKGKWFKSAASRDKYIAGQARWSKKLAYDEAKRTGDWSKFNKTFTRTKRESPYQFEGKFFKSKESMDKFKEGAFWKKYYATTDFTERQKLLDANPEYRNKDFKLPQTDEEWDAYKADRKAKQRAKLAGIPSWMAAYEKHKAATPVRMKFTPSKKIVWKG